MTRTIRLSILAGAILLTLITVGFGNAEEMNREHLGIVKKVVSPGESSRFRSGQGKVAPPIMEKKPGSNRVMAPSKSINKLPTGFVKQGSSKFKIPPGFTVNKESKNKVSYKMTGKQGSTGIVIILDCKCVGDATGCQINSSDNHASCVKGHGSKCQTNCVFERNQSGSAGMRPQ